MTDLLVKRTKVFISYSHKDAEYLERLQVHLKPLERQGIVDRWDDTRIKTGQHGKDEIKKSLEEAQIAVLLISADFLASDFIADEEIPPLLKAEEDKGLIIMPIILKPCQFDRTPFIGDIQAVNGPNHPLVNMTEGESEHYWNKLANDIEDALKPNP